MIEHFLSPEATQDLDDIWWYVFKDRKNPDIADRLVQSITKSFLFIMTYPGIGVGKEDIGPGIRSWKTGRYLVYYRQSGDKIEVVRVVDGARDIPSLFNG